MKNIVNNRYLAIVYYNDPKIIGVLNCLTFFKKHFFNYFSCISIKNLVI